MAGKRELDKERMFEKIMPSAAMAGRQGGEDAQPAPESDAAAPMPEADAPVYADTAEAAAEVFTRQPPPEEALPIPPEPQPQAPAMAEESWEAQAEPAAQAYNAEDVPAYTDAGAFSADEAAGAFEQRMPEETWQTAPERSAYADTNSPVYIDLPTPAAEAGTAYAPQPAPEAPAYVNDPPNDSYEPPAAEATPPPNTYSPEMAVAEAYNAPETDDAYAETPQPAEPPPRAAAPTVLPVNLAEILMQRLYPRYRAKFNACPCSRCHDDACAIALNKVRLRYVPSDRIDPAAFQDRALVTETVTALVKALLLVKRKPRHTEEDLLRAGVSPAGGRTA